MKRSLFLLFAVALLLVIFHSFFLVDFSPARGAEIDRHVGVPEKCLKEENYPQLSEAETRFCRDAVSQGLFRDLEKTRAEAAEAKKEADELDKFIRDYQKKVEKWRRR